VIVVDTSIWIAASRDGAGRIAKMLGTLIDADEVALARPVRCELMAGIARKDRTAFKRALRAVPVVVPTESTWDLLESWIEPAADAGHRFAVTDLVIAALTKEIGGLLWSADDDFARMSELGLVDLYAPK
jgi:predicted nucleic acid-binding protein